MKKLLIGLVILLVLVIISKDVIVKAIVENGMRIVTGLRLQTGTFKVGIFKPVIDISHLKLLNPEGYPDKIMFNMPRLYVNYDLQDIIKGKIHFNDMKIHMKEFLVEKNKNGKLNLKSLKVVKTQEKTKKQGDKAEVFRIQIDKLELKIGKVLFKDYSKGTPPLIKEYNLNIEDTFENISDGYSVVRLLVVRALRNTAIAHLAEFPMRALENGVSQLISGAQAIVGEDVVEALGVTKEISTETVGKTVGAVEGITEEAVGSTMGAVEKATEQLEGIFTSPFGADKKEE